MAIGLSRLAGTLVGLSGHQGTALPGMAAERVWPDGLATLAGQLGGIVLVVGTNGKTTTAGLISEILGREGERPIANRSGANMRQGIMTSLVRASDLRGRLTPSSSGPRAGVFEVDEVALGQILPDLGPAVIVATNLFRDQLDRYGEADAVVDRWAAALETAAEGSVFVHCADDPRLAMLAAGVHMPRRTFGLAGPPTDRAQSPKAEDGIADDALIGDAIADPITCRTCGRLLRYDWRSIGHIGSFSCPAGHIRRETPDVTVEVIAPSSTPDAGGRSTGATVRLGGSFGDSNAHTGLMGLTSAYNIAGAVAAGTAMGRTVEESAAAIEGYAGPFGRLEWMKVDGRNVVLILVKNTVSLAETVRLGPSLGADVVLLGLNDAPADGRDVSWIWDAPIAGLVADRTVVLTGTRSGDLRLRIKYDQETASTPPRSIEQRPELAEALDLAVASAPRGGVVAAAATYTAMLGLRAIIERRGAVAAAPL